MSSETSGWCVDGMQSSWGGSPSCPLCGLHRLAPARVRFLPSSPNAVGKLLPRTNRGVHVTQPRSPARTSDPTCKSFRRGESCNLGAKLLRIPGWETSYLMRAVDVAEVNLLWCTDPGNTAVVPQAWAKSHLPSPQPLLQSMPSGHFGTMCHI